MERKDWTLLAICAANAKGLSPVQLQKTLFLLGEELPRFVGNDFYQFSPYHYGPFDRSVYDDAEKLADEGLVAITQRSGENWNRYLATAEGCARAEGTKESAPAAAVEYLNNVVAWALRQSFTSLVRAIYERYPRMKANSVFQS
jgi:uncharacterized protein YwgA